MKLSREEVLKIARLARLGVDEKDVEIFQVQLSNILNNFEILKKVDTENIQPTAQLIPLKNVMSPDEVSPSYVTEDVLANAPNREDNFFKVRAVLEE